MSTSDPPQDDPHARAQDGAGDDLNRLAKEYVDMWQGYLAHMAQDETLNTGLVAMMKAATDAATNHAATNTGARDDHTAHHQEKEAPYDPALFFQCITPFIAAILGGGGAPPRSTPDGTTHGTDDVLIRNLFERIERMEERLARLETPDDGTA